MAITHNIGWTWQSGTTSFEYSEAVSAGMEVNLDEQIADAQVDKAVAFVLDKDALKSFYMVSDVAVTVETNSGSVPANSFVLVAGVPMVWTANCKLTNPITTDITALYVTNASGAVCNLKIRALVDPTP